MLMSKDTFFFFVIHLSKDREQIPTQTSRMSPGNVTYEGFVYGFTVS